MTLRIESDWRLFDHDPETGKQTWIRIEGTKVTLRTVMPVDDVVALNAEAHAASMGQRHDDGLSKVARVPMNIWARQLAPAIMQDDKAYVGRWLNDPDHARFRTRGGVV